MKASGHGAAPRVRKPGNPARAWSQLVMMLGRHPRLVAGLVVASVLSGLAEAGVLALVAQAAAALVAGTSRVTVNLGPFTLREAIRTLLVVGIILAVVRLGLQVVVSVIPARISARTQMHLREETFTAFTRASWGEQSRDLDGHLQEILTNQVTWATWGAMQASLLVLTGSSVIVLVLAGLALDPLAALVVVVTACGLFIILRPLSNLGTRRAQATARASMGYAEGVNESVRIAEEMHVFGIGPAQRQEMGQLLGDFTAPFYQSQLVARLVPGLYQSLLYIIVVAALLVLALSGAGRFASLGAVVLLLVRAGSYAQLAQGAGQAIRQAFPYLERVHEAQDKYDRGRERTGNQEIRAIDSLVFDAVSFGYSPRELVLRDLDFTIERHEAIGVIGPTGAGKSSLVQLILRLREPDQGKYLVNGLAARDVSDHDWHRLVAYVPQEPKLLHASVAENIRFRRPITDEAVQRAARLAGIHDEIIAWSAGYDTLIGPRADAVSGGQKQRICLARALAAEPELLILDEPTSALDPRSEQVIQASLTGLRSRLTLVVIAHRMSTLSICDRVMVILAGEMEAFEPLETLALSSPYYDAVSGIGHKSLAE